MSPHFPVDDMDEDDICPVCESECTCRRPNAPTLSALSSTAVGSGNVNAAVQTLENSNEGVAHAPRKEPTLKIKLTLPVSMQAKSLVSASTSKPANARSTKKKSKNVLLMMSDDASDGGSSSNLAPRARSHSQAHTGVASASTSAPKKRGRPPKNAFPARTVAKAQRSSHSAGQRDVDTDQDIYNVSSSRLPTRKLPVPKSGLTKTVVAKKTKKLRGAAPIRKYKKPTVTAVPIYESSELSEIDDSDDAASIQFPTFISACSSVSSDSSDSEWASDSNLSGGADRDSRKRQREHQQGDHTPPLKWERHNKWEIRPRKKSVGAEGSSEGEVNGDDSSDDSDEDEEKQGDQEAEADADAEPEEDEEDVEAPGMRRLMRYAGVTAGWTDDDESIDDADLFFANLSDSSSDDPSPADMIGSQTQNYTGETVIDDDEVMEEVFEADILGFDLGLGESVLNALTLAEVANEFKHVRTDSLFMGPLRDDSLRLQTQDGGYAFAELNDADVIMATSEEEEAVAAFETGNETTQNSNSNTQSTSDSDQELRDEEDVDDIMLDMSDGSTTEDEYVDVDGIATPRNLVLLRFPASLGAVDPMRTMSPPVNGVTSRSRANDMQPQKVPRPADILSGRTFLASKGATQGVVPHCAGSIENAEKNKASKVAGEDATGLRLPPMGAFAAQLADATKKVVITGSTRDLPPSPFPAIKRLRRRSTSSGKHSRSGVSVLRTFIFVKISYIIFRFSRATSLPDARDPHRF